MKKLWVDFVFCTKVNLYFISISHVTFGITLILNTNYISFCWCSEDKAAFNNSRALLWLLFKFYSLLSVKCPTLLYTRFLSEVSGVIHRFGRLTAGIWNWAFNYELSIIYFLEMLYMNYFSIYDHALSLSANQGISTSYIF